MLPPAGPIRPHRCDRRNRPITISTQHNQRPSIRRLHPNNFINPLPIQRILSLSLTPLPLLSTLHTPLRLQRPLPQRLHPRSDLQRVLLLALSSTLAQPPPSFAPHRNAAANRAPAVDGSAAVPAHAGQSDQADWRHWWGGFVAGLIYDAELAHWAECTREGDGGGVGSEGVEDGAGVGGQMGVVDVLMVLGR